jgi:hypothetical protein
MKYNRRNATPDASKPKEGKVEINGFPDRSKERDISYRNEIPQMGSYERFNSDVPAKEKSKKPNTMADES